MGLKSNAIITMLSELRDIDGPSMQKDDQSVELQADACAQVYFKATRLLVYCNEQWKLVAARAAAEGTIDDITMPGSEGQAFLDTANHLLLDWNSD